MKTKNKSVHIPWDILHIFLIIWIILCMGSANERRRYTVTQVLIGQAQTQNDPWITSIYHM